MKNDPDRIIDLQKIKKSRRSKRRCLIAIVVGLVVLVLAGVGLVIFAQISEVIQPGGFWTNFSSAA